MSDDQQDEIQKLKDKVSQLLSEKKKVQAERDVLREQVDTLTSERDNAAQELQRITVDLPRLEVLEAVAVDGMADVLKRELEHHYEIVRGEDGQDYFQTKDGEPVEVEGKPVEFSPKGISTLHEKQGLKIGAMIRGSGASGGGATGAGVNAITGMAKTTQDAPRSSFGLR